jgi:hypothetical protein
MSWIYRPNHPNANENGMIERHLVHEDKPWTVAVISDTMVPLKHHGTGKVIDSKRAFSAETRAAGMVELGNEPIRPREPIKLDKRQRVEDIKRTIYELKNR